MQIHVLASGSKGNSILVRTEDYSFLIDAGISYQRLKKKFEELEFNDNKLDALFITHEHSDHIAGLKGLLKSYTIGKIFITQGTYDALKPDINGLMVNVTIIKADKDFVFNDLFITPFELSHDAKEPVGFVFKKPDGVKWVLLTDTGYVDINYHEMLKDASLYILEANHDVESLIKSKRPYPLKMRIVGQYGHLSNDDAAYLMNSFVTNSALWVVAHMSEDCNDRYYIEKAIVDHFDNPLKIDVLYASQDTLKVIKL